MKKIYLIIAAALTLGAASCNKNEVPAYGTEKVSEKFTDGRITFCTAAEGTKAVQAGMTETTAATIEANGFKVAAAVGTSTYFNEVASFVDADPDYYVTAGTYYYPMTSAIDFWGVSPASQAITVSSGVATVAYTSVGTTDLVGAKATAAAASSGNTALVFNHLLSQVKVACHGSDNTSGVTYKVTDIKLTNKASGTYAFATDSWGSLGSAQVFDLLDSEAAASTDTGIFSDMGTVPSVIPAECSLEIAWDTYQDGVKIASYDVDNVTFTPSMGKLCTVNATLPNSNANRITFTISVNAWGSESQSLTFNPA